jgi:hypothetical protein
MKAPLYRVRCPKCRSVYETRSFLRQIVTRHSCRACSDKRRHARAKKTVHAPRPVDLPPPASFATKQHGTRVRYVAGCRCEPCRLANNAYARMRMKLKRLGEGNPLVDAARTRRHLERLSKAGVGRRTIADIARVPESTLCALRKGTRLHLRAATAARILAVGTDVRTDASVISAEATWRLIDRLREEGYTKGAIAQKLGNKRAALQIRKDRVTARTQARVERLFRELVGVRPPRRRAKRQEAA